MNKTITFDTDKHKVVPIEPTEEMHVAAVRTIVRCTGNDDFPPRVYRAMLAAVPDADQLPGVVVHSGEPVAWTAQHKTGSIVATMTVEEVDQGFNLAPDWHYAPLYLHPAPSQPSAEAIVQAQPPCDNAHVKEGCEQFTHWTVTAPDGGKWTGDSLMDAIKTARSATVDPVAAHARLMKAIEEDRQEERKEKEALVQAALEAARNECQAIYTDLRNSDLLRRAASLCADRIRALSAQQIIESCKEKS